MNDEEALADVRTSLAQARGALDAVHMRRPVAELVAAGRARQRRRWLSGGALGCVALAVSLLLTGVLPASGPAPGGGVAQARTVAYVVNRVERALAGEHLVFYARSTGNDGPSVTWAYGLRNRWEEFWPATDYRDRIVHGRHLWDFPPQDRGEPYLAQGTALVRGKLRGAYVTYFDRRYSLGPVGAVPPSACSKTDRLSMGGPPTPTPRWSEFLHATLACGAASVTGHVWIDGVQTTRITGKPLTVRLSAGYGRLVREKWVQARWVLYVNPRTYLPVRIYGATESFGGRSGKYTSYSVTDVTWLPPTRVNIAKTLVTIPPGFHLWRGNPGNQ